MRTMDSPHHLTLVLGGALLGVVGALSGCWHAPDTAASPSAAPEPPGRDAQPSVFRLAATRARPACGVIMPGTISGSAASRWFPEKTFVTRDAAQPLSDLDRWSPHPGDPFRELCWHLVERSGLEPEGPVY
jgi:hypothetical protein